MENSDKSLQLLVIEDNMGDYVLIEEYLSDKFSTLSLTHAETASSAEEILSKPQIRFDLILLDLTLPDMKGEELIQKIVNLSGSVPVIVLTGFSNLDFSIRSLSLGVNDYLIKDEITPTLLLKSILHAMERQVTSLKLKESEQQFRSLFENAADAIFIADTETGIILDANRAAEKLVLRPREEIIGLHQSQLHPEKFREHGVRLFQTDALKPSNALSETPFDAHIVRSDGQIIPVEILTSKVFYRQKECLMGTFRNVTERNKYVNEIKKYKTISDFAMHGSAISTMDGVILYINDYFASVHGYQPEELIGKHLSIFHAENHMKLLCPLLEELQQKGNYGITEVPHLKRDGTEFPMLMSGLLITDESTGEQLMAATAIDISARKEAENRIRESERELASSHELMNYVIEHSNSGVAIHDKELNYIYVSQKYIDQFGLREMEIIGRHHYDVFPDLPERWKEVHLRALHGEVLKADKDAFITPEGKQEWTKWECRPWFGPDGTVGGIIVYTEVITREMEMQEQLRVSEESFRGSFENAATGMAIANQTSRIFRVNEALCSILGYTKEEITGKTYVDLIHPGERKKHLRNMVQIRTGKMNHFHSEDRYVHKKGFILWGILSVSVVRDKDGDPLYYIGQITDITGKKRAELELEKLNSELEKKVEERTRQLKLANKELESFSYSVSHDLRAPLRAIDGFSHAVLEDYSDKLDETGIGYLNRVRGASQKLSHLIDEFLDLARVSRASLHTTQINMTEIVNTVLGVLKSGDPERVIHFHVQEFVMAHADLQQMKIVMQNLLENAWKYSSGKENARIEFGMMHEGHRKIYYVRDNGAGFNMDYYEKLFIPFQRLHNQNEFSGSGIGLATVKRIIDRHHGTIWAESEEGRGAVFYFTLGKSG